MSQTEKDDKTEDATLGRLENMRRDGDIAMGREIVTFAAFGVGVMALAVTGPALVRRTVELVQASAAVSARYSDAPTKGAGILLAQSSGLVWLVYGCIAAACGAAILVGGVQTGAGIWTKRLAPDFKKLVQLSRLTKIFSGEFPVDLALSFVKATLLLGAVIFVVKDQVMTFAAVPGAATVHAPGVWLGVLGRITIASAAVLFVLGVLDLLVQRQRFFKKARMSKDEVKREHKENEGDPQIKSRRRQKHRELLKGRIDKEVPAADAIVVNPTHIAIAIRYARGKDRAPKVVCKGKDARADRIREVARENGVPIVKDVWLARLLFKQVKVGREVPEEAYKAVAAVLAFVYRVTGRAPGAER